MTNALFLLLLLGVATAAEAQVHPALAILVNALLPRASNFEKSPQTSAAPTNWRYDSRVTVEVTAWGSGAGCFC